MTLKAHAFPLVAVSCDFEGPFISICSCIHAHIQTLILVFSIGVILTLLVVITICAVCMLHRARYGEFCCIKPVSILISKDDLHDHYTCMYENTNAFVFHYFNNWGAELITYSLPKSLKLMLSIKWLRLWFLNGGLFNFCWVNDAPANELLSYSLNTLLKMCKKCKLIHFICVYLTVMQKLRHLNSSLITESDGWVIHYCMSKQFGLICYWDKIFISCDTGWFDCAISNII